MSLVLVVARPPHATADAPRAERDRAPSAGEAARDAREASPSVGDGARDATGLTAAGGAGGPDAAAAAAVARTDVWRAVRDEVAELGAWQRATRPGSSEAGPPPRRSATSATATAASAAAASTTATNAPTVPGEAPAAAGGVAPGDLELLAAAIANDEGDPDVTYAADPQAAVEAVERSIRAGADAIAVVPVALAMDAPGDALRDPALVRLHADLEAVGRRYPEVDLQYVGPPFHHAPALEAAIAALRPPGSEEPALLAGAVARAFGGDLERFGRFMAALQGGVPAGTKVVLRGSAVQGASYKTGEPFDARGPGTSDLDVVLLGDEAMAAWRSDAFYLAGVNTQPLDDGSPDIADPRLEHARREAQAAAGRPVALQAMARWFLDLRSGLQGTPYVVLAG